MIQKTEFNNVIGNKYTVEFIHCRKNLDSGVLKKGTKFKDLSNDSTICTIYSIVNNKPNPLCVAGSVCHKDDNFVKAIGRKLAFTKAVSYIVNKEDRALLWNWFKGYSPKSFRKVI